MKIETFLELWLPDCELKQDAFLESHDIKLNNNPIKMKVLAISFQDFFNKYFFEALQNYTDKIC
jgi:hypothetical protein